MKKTYYYCDWCERMADQPDHVNPDWAVDLDGTILCIACKNDRTKALDNARRAAEKRSTVK